MKGKRDRKEKEEEDDVHDKNFLSQLGGEKPEALLKECGGSGDEEPHVERGCRAGGYLRCWHCLELKSDKGTLAYKLRKDKRVCSSCNQFIAVKIEQLMNGGVRTTGGTAGRG